MSWLQYFLAEHGYATQEILSDEVVRRSCKMEEAVVKTEPEELEIEYDYIETVKQEIDIGPTQFQRPVVLFDRLPIKEECVDEEIKPSGVNADSSVSSQSGSNSDVLTQVNVLQREKGVTSFEKSKLVQQIENKEISAYSLVECSKMQEQLVKESSMHRNDIRSSENSYNDVIYRIRVVDQRKLSSRDSIQTSSNLQDYMRILAVDKPFYCSVCNASFNQRGSLESHMRIHTGEKPFTCAVCNASFRHEGSLQCHIRIHTGVKPFTCSVCKTKFRQKGSLQIHMRIHTGEKPFACSVCKANFRHEGSLQCHMRIHTGEKPFKCSVCLANFRQEGGLQSHMRIHTGEKPFACSVCDAKFSQKVSLNQHTRIHTGEKPFTCSVCKTNFRRKVSLRQHMRIHTGEKPFACSKCNTNFRHEGSLQRHMKIHIDEKS